jgi:large subunit ribosomal protein L22
MEIISTQKYVRLAPKKIRPVVNLIKRMKVQEAIEKLPFVNKNGSEYLLKVIKAASANAKNRGISEETLFIKEIQITEGPRLKRGIPVSRGQWHPILKRMSHIRVTLGVREEKKIEKKEVKKSNMKALENKKKDIKKGSKK